MKEPNLKIVINGNSSLGKDEIAKIIHKALKDQGIGNVTVDQGLYCKPAESALQDEWAEVVIGW